MSMENYGEIISTGKLLIRLWKSYQQSHLVAKQEEPGEGNDEFGLQSIFVHTSK
jgi:hypothetical protein